MLVSSGFDELNDAKMAIENFNETEPSIYQKFLNIIHLTRQFQNGYQYMGALLMDEDPRKQPKRASRPNYNPLIARKVLIRPHINNEECTQAPKKNLNYG